LSSRATKKKAHRDNVEDQFNKLLAFYDSCIKNLEQMRQDYLENKTQESVEKDFAETDFEKLPKWKQEALYRQFNSCPMRSDRDDCIHAKGHCGLNEDYCDYTPVRER
jgi:hypothetical protein